MILIVSHVEILISAEGEQPFTLLLVSVTKVGIGIGSEHDQEDKMDDRRGQERWSCDRKSRISRRHSWFASCHAGKETINPRFISRATSHRDARMRKLCGQGPETDQPRPTHSDDLSSVPIQIRCRSGNSPPFYEEEVRRLSWLMHRPAKLLTTVDRHQPQGPLRRPPRDMQQVHSR